MNNVLAEILDTNVPRFSKKVTEGVAEEILKYVPTYLDNIIKDSIKSIPGSLDLVYEGYRILSPEEEYDKLFTSKDNKIPFDLASSDIYLIEMIFRYNGQPIVRPIYLPYSSRGNLFKVSGVIYHIIPVLSDTVISPSFKEVFVRLFKNKLSFKNVSKSFILNGNKIHGHMIYSNIFRVNTSYLYDRIGNQFVATALYPVAKYGILSTLAMYTDIDKIIITDTDDVSEYRNDKWNVYESYKVKPRGLKTEGYVGHNVKFIVPNIKTKNQQFLDNLIYGLIYTLDVLPEHSSELVELFNNNNVEDEKFYWKVMIGRIAYRNAYSVNRIINDIEEHFISLEGYIDSLIKAKLAEANIYVNNLFDLLVVILENYNIWLIHSKEYNSDINNRYIDILYYLFYETIVGFNRVTLAVTKRLSRKEPSFKEINKIFQDEMRTKSVYKLTKSSETNLAIGLAESTSDLIYPKITAVLEDQSRGNGVNRGNKTQFPESTKTIKGQDLIIGSLLFLTKTAPSPRFRTNIFMDYNIWTGKLNVPKSIEKSANKLDTLLQGKLVNDKIENSILDITSNEDIGE